MGNSIEKRIFIVGTARSGTTLLQNLLAGHPEIFTLPETHFIDKTLHPRKFIRNFQIIKRRQIQIIAKLRDEIGLKKKYEEEFSIPSFSKTNWGKFILSIIDREAETHKKSIWLEKTPRNIRYIDFIDSLAENIFFIHMHRDPEDNIASLYDVGKKYPNYFKQDTLEACISRYKVEYQISKRYVESKNHFHIIYEDLVKDTELILEDLCTFLEIEYYKNMIDHQASTKQIVIDSEKWKEKNFKQIEVEKKSEKLFDNSELIYLKNEVKEIDLGVFRRNV